MKEAKLVIDGEEYIFGEKYFMLDINGKWLEKELIGYDFNRSTQHKFINKSYMCNSQISKTDPTDKRNLLKGYGVVCKTPEQADKMEKFMGDMFKASAGDWSNTELSNTLQFNRGGEAHWNSSVTHRSSYNHLGNKSFKEACELCDIEYVEPNREVLDQIAVLESELAKLKEKVS